MSRGTLLVTGARGTVGNYVVSLAEAAGWRVVASDLSVRGLRVPTRGEVRVADLRDVAALDGLVASCDAVIHTAAELDVTRPAAALAAINTEAVANLYEAAARAGAKRFVHLSTAALYERGDTPLDESSSLAPEGPYGLSKLGAEVFLRGLGAQTAPAWTVLRAAPIYGRRGRHFAASLLSVGPILRLTMPVVPRPTGGPAGTMVHAEDVARASLFVLDQEAAHGRALDVSDGDVLGLGERIGVTFDAYGLRSISTGKTPEAFFDLLGRVLRARNLAGGLDAAALLAWRTVVARHRLKPALRPRFDREVLDLVGRPLVVRAKALRELGWEPRFPSFEAGFREVLRWVPSRALGAAVLTPRLVDTPMAHTHATRSPPAKSSTTVEQPIGSVAPDSEGSRTS